MKKLFLLLLLPLTFTLIIFRKFFLNGYLPIPADILSGGYFPWLDDKWGYVVKVPVKNGLPSDVFSIIYPWKIQALNIIKSGFLPLWDPSILLGVPLFANFQAALLNPANLLFFVLPVNLAWSWQVILQPILLFGSGYLFLRNIKVSNYSSILGSIFLMFSGYVLVWLEYNSMVYTLIYFPLVLYLVDKICAKPKIQYSFFIGIVLALQIFSGYPLNTFYTIVVGIAYFLYRCFFFRLFFLLKTFLLTLGVITGIGCAAIQLLPGQELASLSIRNLDNSAQAAEIKYLPPKHLISFISPDFFGNPGTQNYWSLGSYDNFAFFIPAVGAFLFFLSLSTKIAFKRDNLVFLLFCLGSLLYALQNPVSEYLGNLQIIGLGAAVNARILFVFIFGTSVLAALTLDYLLKNKVTLFQTLIPLGVFISLMAVVAFSYYQTQALQKSIEAIVSSSQDSSDQIMKLARDSQEELKYAKRTLMIGIRNTILPLGVSVLAFFIFTIGNKRLILFALPFLILPTVYTFDKYLSFTRPDVVFPKLQSLETFRELTGSHRFEREKTELLPANSWTAYGLRSPSGQNAVAPLSTVRYLELINREELNDQVLTRFVHVTNTKSSLFNTLDIETFGYLDRHEKESIPFKDGRPFPWIIPETFKEVADLGTMRVYKNTQNLGSSWFTNQVYCETDLNKIAEILTSQNFNSKEKTVVNCPDGLKEGSVGTSELVSETPNSITFKTKNETDNYLIISRSNYPGWRASVDTTATSIQTANMALMSVYVPKGEHIVELLYDPDSIKLGAKISGFTLVLWLAFFTGRYFLTFRKR